MKFWNLASPRGRGYGTRAPVLVPCARAREIWKYSTRARAFGVLSKTIIKHDQSTNFEVWEIFEYLFVLSVPKLLFKREFEFAGELWGKKWSKISDIAKILLKNVQFLWKTARETTISEFEHV
jgi:hypothetical protein